MTNSPEHSITVLFIDDEATNLEAYKMNFRRDLNVRCALNTTDARAILNFEQIDIVVSDQRMPGITGVEFLAEIKKSHPDIMRILVTAYSDIQAVIQAINEAAVFNYLTKPFQPAELLAQIERAYLFNSAQKERELFLKRSEHMFEISQNAVVLFDSNGKILDVNPSMVTLLGYPKVEFKYLGMSEILMDSMALLQNTVNGHIDPRPVPLLLKTQDGRLLNCEIAAKHISTTKGGIANYQAVILGHTVVSSKLAG